MPPTFTTLPLEVRNEIYSHVFNFGSIIPCVGYIRKHLLFNPAPERSDGFYMNSDPQQILALLYISHQISDEAATYFYGRIKFKAEWFHLAAFVKGIGARRRDLIRSVEILHPAWLPFDISNDGFLKMLGGLPSLRTVGIFAFVRDFSRLQDKLVQGGILEFAETVDITVHNTCSRKKISDSTQSRAKYYKDEYIWSCAKDTTQWTGGELIQTIVP